MPFSFSHRKATQALNFFARKAGGRINKMKALKLVYFADRYHLRKYGRPVVGDEYLAMNYGPVASGTKDLAEMSDFLGEEEERYAKRFIRPAESAITYSSIHNVDEKVLSESDREALEFVWGRFGRTAEFALSKLTHRYPDWKKQPQQLDSADHIAAALDRLRAAQGKLQVSGKLKEAFKEEEAKLSQKPK